MNYRVKALSLSGLNKRMFDSGDIVTEENFPEGNVPRLIAEGFLEEIPQETSDVESDKGKDKESTEDASGSEEEKSGKGKKKK